jgi:hypothetical protein
VRKPVLFWILSFVLTAGSGVYQRVTGPSYPLSGVTVIDHHPLAWKFDRSHPEMSDHPVVLTGVPDSVHGVLLWRRHKTGESWWAAPMERAGDTLRAVLPQQPPAGKLDYRLRLFGASDSLVLPGGDPVVIRFTAEVPPVVLILHVIAMFVGMLLSTRTGLEAFATTPRFERFIPWTLAFLLMGGFLLGPIMQKYAFGEYWTGWPFGHDLTDNKTVVAVLAWVGAAVAVFRQRSARTWVMAAAVVTLVIFLIPHSLLGSELDYGSTESPPPAGLPR